MKKLTTILLLLAFMPSLFSQVVEEATQDRDLKILSWNIYMLPSVVPMKGRLERAHAIVDTLQKAAYDIIVFQEAFHTKALAIIEKGLDAAYPYRYGPFNMPKSPFKFSSGVWILSKIPMNELATIQYTDHKDADRFAQKGAALLQGEFHGRKFQLMGTHMQANENRADIRSKQFRQMYDSLLLKYHSEGIPQILCGDMNTETTIQKEYCEMLQCLDAEDSEFEGIQKETYDGTNNLLAESVWKKQKTTLDYILLRSNGAKIHSVRRSVSVFKRSWRKDRNDLSDHYGVSCEVRF